MTVLLEFYYLTALLEYTKPAMTTAVVLIPALSNQGRIQEPARGGAQTGYRGGSRGGALGAEAPPPPPPPPFIFRLYLINMREYYNEILS